jgi:hypothetical protein
MNTRTIRKTVTFTQPFRLVGVDDIQSPGDYEVNTDEEQIDSLTFLAWRRIATNILLSRNGATQMYRIDPVDLDASLLRDAGATRVPVGKD